MPRSKPGSLTWTARGLSYRASVAKSVCSPVDAQQMWHLADDGDAYETFDEPSHHRCGDEGSHPAHTQCAEEQEKDTDQDCEGGSERIEVCRALYRDGAHS
jgi:hypothetical protein